MAGKGESRLENKRRPGSDWGSISICDREQFFRRETSDELGEKLALSCSLFHAASRNKVFKVDCRNFGRPKSSSPPEYVWVKLKPGFCFFPGSLMSYARKFWSVGQPSWLSRLTQDGNNTWGITNQGKKWIRRKMTWWQRLSCLNNVHLKYVLGSHYHMFLFHAWVFL